MATAPKKSFVTFLSDFGLEDSYVGEVKGALLSRAPATTIIDLTHSVPAFQVEVAAFHLLRSYRHFPAGTVHLAVVDPGVGTDRACLFVRTKDYRFFGPDNGVLRWAVDDCAVREGKKPEVFRIPVNANAAPTFHARDIFAPAVATVLAKPKSKRPWPKAEMGGKPFPKPQQRPDGSWVGTVIAVDRYGNLVTSVPADQPGPHRARLADRGASPVSAPNYQAIPDGELGLIRGSHGFWEIACRSTSASERTKAKLGHEVAVSADQGT